MAEEKKTIKEEKKIVEKVETKKVETKTVDQGEHFATAKSVNLPISTKQSVEVASFIRDKTLQKAKMLLKEVVEHKKAVPYKRYNRDTGHKPGKIAAGRYPEKAIDCFLKLLNTAEANAEDKGLDSKNLIIIEMKADKGTQQWHQGRQKRRRMKNTHLSVKVAEIEK
jgi:large subunit ribosomal protein L22